MIELTVALLVFVALCVFMAVGLIGLILRLFFGVIAGIFGLVGGALGLAAGGIGLLVMLPVVLLLCVPALILFGLSIALLHVTLPFLLLAAVVVWALRSRSVTPPRLMQAPEPR
jgi:hypothetical protein